MIDVNDWDLREHFVWRPRGPVITPRDHSAAHPGELEVTLYPVEARVVLLHAMTALVLPALFLVGSLIYATGWLPEIVVGSVILAFLWGLYSYFRQVQQRKQILELMPGVRKADILPLPHLFGIVILPCFIWPLAIVTVAVFAVWSGNHFVAIAVPAFVCFYTFYFLGSEPVRFWQEYLFAQPEVEPADRHFRPRPKAAPDVLSLLAVLFVLVTAPILLSTSHTIFLLAVLLVTLLAVKLRRVRHRRPGLLLLYLLRRCHYLLHVYLDQRDAYAHERGTEWTPPSSRASRFVTFVWLYVVLCAVLLTGLTYYMPWEFFAAMFVPNFETGFLMTRPSHSDYGWLIEPFQIAFTAQPVAGYLVTFVFAIVGFLLFPPMLLLVMYFERLIDLEELHQENKAARRLYD